MNTLILLVALAVTASAVPLPEQLVDVIQDSQGYYKFVYKTENSSRTEERHHDGTTTGTFTYVDSNGITQTVHYVAGVDGVIASGSTLPVEDKTPVQETAEVYNTRNEHLAVVNAIASLLPPAGDDGFVPAKPEVSLDKQEFLAAVANFLHSQSPLVFTAETPEITAAKEQLYNAYVTAVGQ